MSGCGALLTPYKLPDNCFQPTFTTSNAAFLATDPGCFPSACNGGYYSPGVCPQGWNTYTVWQSNWPSPRPKTGETAIGCCYGSLTGTNANMACAGYITATAGVTIDSQNSTLTTTFPLSTVSVVAYDIKIRNQDSDTAILSAAAMKATATSSSSSTLSTSTSSASSAFTTSAIPASTATSTPTSTPAPTGLSTGAKAAIGVCIPIAVIALLIGTFFFFRRRAQRERMAGEDALPGAGSTVTRAYSVGPSSVHTQDRYTAGPPEYMAAMPAPHLPPKEPVYLGERHPTQELYGQHAHPQEMDSVQLPVEAPGEPVPEDYRQHSGSESPDEKKDTSTLHSMTESPVSGIPEGHDRFHSFSPVSAANGK